MKKIKTAIIGCGNIYKVHADVLSRLEGVEMVAVVDIKKDKAKEAALLYKCDYFTDYKELLDYGIDVVHICTPHYLHSPMSIEMMKAGIDVLVEKPLALNVEQGLQMLEISRKTARRLGVVFQNRFNKNIVRAKELLGEGYLGKILGIKGIITWFRNKDYYLQDKWRGHYETEGGGVLINQAIHTLDLLQWFAGKVNAVKGRVDTRLLGDVIEVEDTAEATLYFENGITGLFYATNCFTNNSPVEIDIHCEGGMIELSGSEMKVTGSEKDFKFTGEKKTGYKSYWGYGHYQLIGGFYKDILDKTNKYMISAEEGIKTLKLIEGINSSSRSNEKYYFRGGDY